MNERQIKFIELLLKNEKYKPVHEWAEKLKVSEKTLHRDIDKINREIEFFNAFIEKKAGVGVKINIDNANKKKFFEQIMKQIKNKDEIQNISWSKDYRIMDIALNFLLYTEEKVLISDLAYKYFVSRSSIINDLCSVEESFQLHHIDLKKEKGRVFITGREENIRIALTDLIDSILKCSLEENRDKYSEANIMMTILECFSESDLSNTEYIIREFEEKENYYFDENEYGRVSISILVMVYRVRQKYFITDAEIGDDNENDELYRKTKWLIEKISIEFNLQIPRDEMIQIYQILQETHLFYQIYQKIDERKQETAEAFVNDFIDAFSIIMEINIREEFSLYQNIRSHISLMVDRVVENNQARNPLVTQIREEYEEVTKICQIICWILEKRFSLPEISLDEICYLALYIQGEIMEQEENADILLVSNHSQGIVNLIRHKLLTKHSKWKIDGCSYYEFCTKNIHKYDFIISTQGLEGKNQNIPYVQISPVVTEMDWNLIDQFFHYAKESSKWYLQKLVGTVTDLKDIGCKVEIIQDNIPIMINRESIRIEGLKDITYLYTYQKGGENICRFSVEQGNERIKGLKIEMGNWDYMLFASKLFYYLGSCGDEVMTDFTRILIERGSLDV